MKEASSSLLTDLTVASLYSGVGGLDYGFKQLGFNILWANEKSSDAAKSYASLIGHQPKIDDIENVLDSIPTVDVILGGPPCQSFSLVGKRLDEDPRSKHVWHFLNAVKRAKPKFFVMENVPGITSAKIDGLPLVEELERRFRDLGYTTKRTILNAFEYGVPQRRRRVFLLGTLYNDAPIKIIDPISFLEHFSLPLDGTTAKQALDDLTPVPVEKGLKAPYFTGPSNGFQILMRERSNQDGVSLHHMPTMSVLDRLFVEHIPPGGNYMNIPDEIATQRILRIKREGGRTTTYGRLHPDKPSYTLNTYFNRPNVGSNYHYSEQRLITVREALRLQSFPDKFTPVFSTQRSLHTQVGNAVPPLLSQAIALSIARSVQKESRFG